MKKLILTLFNLFSKTTIVSFSEMEQKVEDLCKSQMASMYAFEIEKQKHVRYGEELEKWGNTTELKYKIYIAGYDWVGGSTFEEAYDNMIKKIQPMETIHEILID